MGGLVVTKSRVKIISACMAIIITFSTVIQISQVQQSNAAVMGFSGSIPSGGTPGPDGGISMGSPPAAAYRVGITKEKIRTESDYITMDLSNAQVENKLRNHFSNHFPMMENSIIFAPSNNYDANAKLASYNASSGELNIADFVKPTDKAAKLRQIGTTASSRSDTPIFFDDLLSYAPYIDSTNPKKYGDGEVLKGKFSNLQWKNLVNWSGGCTRSCGGDAVKVWNWILQDPNEILNRIKNYTYDDQSDNPNPAKRYEARLHYLDLLMTLWVLSPAGEDKEFYETEIDRYIEKIDLEKRPVLLAIDTVSRFNVPAYSAQKIFIPSIDFVMWAHGATPKSDLRNSAFNAKGSENDTKKLISESARQAMAELPDKKPISERQTVVGNGFAYGYNGVPGWQFSTKSGAPVWGTRGSITKGVMESLSFNSSGTYFGFIVAGGSQNKIDPSCPCGQKVSISMDGKAAPSQVEIKADKIGKTIEMNIDLKQKDEDLDDWGNFLKSGVSNLKMKVRLRSKTS